MLYDQLVFYGCHEFSRHFDDYVLDDTKNRPVDSCQQHAVVVYIDSGNYTEALLRSELANIVVVDGES